MQEIDFYEEPWEGYIDSPDSDFHLRKVRVLADAPTEGKFWLPNWQVHSACEPGWVIIEIEGEPVDAPNLNGEKTNFGCGRKSAIVPISGKPEGLN